MIGEKIRPHQLERKALLYVRQSSAHQVLREVSRFARNSRDWQQLIEMCRVVDIVLIDGETIYAPRQGNDAVFVVRRDRVGIAFQDFDRSVPIIGSDVEANAHPLSVDQDLVSSLTRAKRTAARKQPGSHGPARIGAVELAGAVGQQGLHSQNSLLRETAKVRPRPL